jgi:hypothetical protein
LTTAALKLTNRFLGRNRTTRQSLALYALNCREQIAGCPSGTRMNIRTRRELRESCPLRQNKQNPDYPRIINCLRTSGFSCPVTPTNHASVSREVLRRRFCYLSVVQPVGGSGPESPSSMLFRRSAAARTAARLAWWRYRVRSG